MERNKKVNNVTTLVNSTTKLADNLTTSFYINEDLKVAGLAISSYRVAVNAIKAQLLYKKLTGTPAEIEFLK